MAYEQRDNSGSIFKNDRKETDNHPAYKGQGIVNGVPVWISGWVKNTKEGAPFLSLSFKPKDGATAAPKQTLAQDMDGDTIPFAPEWRG